MLKKKEKNLIYRETCLRLIRWLFNLFNHTTTVVGSILLEQRNMTISLIFRPVNISSSQQEYQEVLNQAHLKFLIFINQAIRMEHHKFVF